jgi:hypothetical protein
MKYIKQPLESYSGHINECWQVVSGSFDLERDTATLMLNGWKDAQARADGKLPDAKKSIDVTYHN